MLVTSHWPWFVQLLPSHERLSGHQLHSWRPRVGFIQSEGSFKQEKLSCLENFINFYHEIFYRFIAWLVTLSFPIWGFHSRPLIVSGWLYQSNEKKFVKGFLWTCHEFSVPSLDVIRDHPRSPLESSSHLRDTEAAWQWSWHHRDVSRQICVTPLVTILFAVCNNSNRMFVQKCLQLMVWEMRKTLETKTFSKSISSVNEWLLWCNTRVVFSYD